MFSDSIYRRLRMVPLRRTRMLRSMTRSRNIFALMATYDVGAMRARTKISRRIKWYRRLWLKLLEQLCTHQLWSPVNDIHFVADDRHDESRFDFAFGVCTRCLPTFVWWAGKPPRDRKKIDSILIPCRKTNVCPACFGAVSEHQYRQCKLVLNQLQADGPVRLTVRTETVFVPASSAYDADYNSQELLVANTQILRQAIAARRIVNGSALHKRLQRQTRGLFWRVLAIPREGGWDVVTRWVFLTCDNKLPPDTIFDPAAAVTDVVVDLPRRVSWTQQHTHTDTDEAVAEALLHFARYPKELLTGNIDLIAAWLHASRSTRVVSGMGALRRAGSGLIRHFKQHDRQQKANQHKAQFCD